MNMNPVMQKRAEAEAARIMAEAKRVGGEAEHLVGMLEETEDWPRETLVEAFADLVDVNRRLYRIRLRILKTCRVAGLPPDEEP
jgi:hypothetical protein